VRYQPGAATIDLEGELTHLAKEALNQAYRETENDDPKVVFLNFGGVSHLDTSGIGLIVSLVARARQSQRSLIAYGLSFHQEQIFKLIGLTELMNILPDEVSALATLPMST
jgi:anti-anti-sigma factor